MVMSESESEEDIDMNRNNPDDFTSESEFSDSPADEPDQENKDVSSDDRSNNDSDVYEHDEGSTSEEEVDGPPSKKLKDQTLHATYEMFDPFKAQKDSQTWLSNSQGQFVSKYSPLS